jgi:hypothetical protein
MKTSSALYKKTNNRITIGSQSRIIYTNKYGTQFIKQKGDYVLLSKKLSGGTGSRSSYTYDRTPNEIQDIKSSEPVVIKAYHGTTNEFYVFKGAGRAFLFIFKSA